MRRPAALGLYLALSRIAGPAVALWLRHRARRGREDRARLSERMGHAPRPRPPGRLVWLHGASVGEAVSILPLVEGLRRAEPGIAILVTTGTVTAAARMAGSLPEGAIHAYLPVDTAGAVRRFLAHWRPDLAVWAESEIWPRLLVETAEAGVPMALVNARLSARSARGWARAPAMARHLFSLFDLIVTQDAETAERLSALGVAGAVVGRNLKSAVAPPPAGAEALAAAREAIGGRPVWLAASTHEGEEAPACAAAARLPEEVLMILAPRHPERGDAVEALLGAAGLASARRSRGEVPGPATRVWLVDTLGEMGLWYRLADVTLVGGSLVERGGHTPFEPAACGSAVLHGPHVANFAPAYAALDAAGAALGVSDSQSLAAALERLLGDGAARAAMTRAAARVRDEMTPDVDALASDLLSLSRKGGASR